MNIRLGSTTIAAPPIVIDSFHTTTQADGSQSASVQDAPIIVYSTPAAPTTAKTPWLAIGAAALAWMYFK